MTASKMDFYILEGGQKGDKRYYGRVRIFINMELNFKYERYRDVKAIRESFEKLNFKVEKPILNKTAEDMIACFMDENVDYFGCAVIFVFSHGENDFIYGTGKAEKGKINVFDNFSEGNNPDLQKCPKFVFNEWCQVPGSSEQKSSAQSADCQETAHWLIFNAALSGYATFVHEEEGSRLIQVFCRRLNKFAQTKDLQEILDLVIGDVSKIKIVQENGSYVSMQPSQHSTLQKKLYLLPEEKVREILDEELQSAAGRRQEDNTKEDEDSKLEGFSSKNDDFQSTAGRLRGEYLLEKEDFSSKEEWQFVSECSSEQHSLQRVGRSTAVVTLWWDGEMGWSAWFPLPAAASTNTRWKVQFRRWPDDDFSICVGCTSLDAHFHAAAVRLIAVVEEAPRVWGEAADILQSGEEVEWWWSCFFSKKVKEFPEVRQIKVRVTAQWTELEHLSTTPNFWMESDARIRCSWQLQGWKAVTPTAERWSLWSEPFGRGGALWRIEVLNRRRDRKRELLVRVRLQHLPALVEWSRMNWKCSLTVWNEQVDEKENNMKRNSLCLWIAVDDVEVETRDPLGVVVIIHVSRKR